MLKTRVIPCLLLFEEGLVKTVKFKNPKYIGDPINAVKIFNEKEVDELIFLDISASVEQRSPNLDLIQQISSECLMPLCYGGGIKSIEEIRAILKLGVEKVSINTHAFENLNFIKEASKVFGSSTIVVSIDVKKGLFGGYNVAINSGKKVTSMNPVEYAQKVEAAGAGEILINSIDNDGVMGGYDLTLIKKVSDAVSIPVIACGGAGKLEDFSEASKNGKASAVAAGSMFVYMGKHRAVMINYPSQKELKQYLS